MVKRLRYARSRLQRSFRSWLEENHVRFTIPVRITRRTDRQIDLTFSGVSKVILATLTQSSLSVPAQYGGQWFDLLLDDDICLPKRVPGGYLCANEDIEP